MSEILTGGDIAALRPFGDNGFRVGDRFYSVREMLDTIARAFAERDALGEALEACVVAMDEWGANEDGIAVDAWDAYEVARERLGVPVACVNPDEAAEGGEMRYLRYAAALAATAPEATRE